MTSISVVGVFYNCQETLEKCIKQVLPIADEFVAIDQGSNDNTSQILQQYATHYEKTENKGYCEYHREYVINKTKNKYVLWLDGDEFWTKELLEYIKLHFIYDTTHDCLKMRRLTFVEDMLVQNEINMSPRFWKKEGIKYEPIIHSQPIGFKNPLERNDLFIIHQQGSVKKTLEKMNTYDIVCNNLLKEGKINESQYKGFLGLAQFHREQIQYIFNAAGKEIHNNDIHNK
jgi:glycosyltransferase involved in cell wall biosynthesis